MKEWNINEIESITEDEAREMCLEEMRIKDHMIYIVDFEGYFGYSCLVFRNNHHIYYANDYELHHSGKSREQLRERYIQKMNSILFTDSEFSAPLKSYGEYSRKMNYLINYYGLQTDYISAFQIFNKDKEEQEFKERVKSMTYNPVNCSYMNDSGFVKRHIKLWDELQKAETEALNDYEYQKSAFLYEMYNHEYGINWQADYDVISCFGKIGYHYEDLNAYFKELQFTEMQKRAYLDARKQYFKETDWNSKKEMLENERFYS